MRDPIASAAWKWWVFFLADWCSEA